MISSNNNNEALTYGQERLRDSPLTPILKEFNNSAQSARKGNNEWIRQCGQISNIPSGSAASEDTSTSTDN